jgi:hypothetical protein
MSKGVPLSCWLLVCVAFALVSCGGQEDVAPADPDLGIEEEAVADEEADYNGDPEEPSVLVTLAQHDSDDGLSGIMDFYLDFPIFGSPPDSLPSFKVGYIYKRVCPRDVDMYLRDDFNTRGAGIHASDGKGRGMSQHWFVEPNIGKQLTVTVSVTHSDFPSEDGYKVTAVVPTDAPSVVHIGGGDLILRSVPRE